MATIVPGIVMKVVTMLSVWCAWLIRENVRKSVRILAQFAGK